MNNDVLTAGATVSFSVNNNLLTLTDLVYVYGSSFSSSYGIVADNTANENGKFNIRVTNKTGMTLTNNLYINFIVLKGANS